jgi:hypothetical protein
LCDGLGDVDDGIEVDIVSDSTGASILVFENSSSTVFIIWVIVVVVSGDVLDKICNVGSIDVETVSAIVVGFIVWDVVISVIVRVGSVMKVVGGEIVDEWNVVSDLSIVLVVVSIIVMTVVVVAVVMSNIGVIDDIIVEAVASVNDADVVVMAEDDAVVNNDIFVVEIAGFFIWFIAFPSAVLFFLFVLSTFSIDFTVVALNNEDMVDLAIVDDIIFFVLDVVRVISVI